MNNNFYTHDHYHRYGPVYYRRRYYSNFSLTANVANAIHHALTRKKDSKNSAPAEHEKIEPSFSKSKPKKVDVSSHKRMADHEKIEPSFSSSSPTASPMKKVRKRSEALSSKPKPAALAPATSAAVKSKAPAEHEKIEPSFSSKPKPAALAPATGAAVHKRMADHEKIEPSFSSKPKPAALAPATGAAVKSKAPAPSKPKAANSNVKSANDNRIKVKEETMKSKIEEAKEVSEVGTKGTPYGPKKLKDIITPGQDEWNGNTEREKQIIAQFKRNTLTWPDVAGNGDDVFSGAKQHRVDMPLKPGEDVLSYKASFNKGIAVGGTSVQSPFVKESFGEGPRGGHPILHHDLDKHWAVVHNAPRGTHIAKDGDTTVLFHPDGSTHHIQGGEVHQKDMTYKGSKSGPAEKGKFNIVHHSEKFGNTFVSNKKTLGFGYTKKTHDEHDAKEFKSRTHAENHVNYHAPHLMNGDHFTIHEKRSGQKIKSDAKSRKDSIGQYRVAHHVAIASGKDPSSDLKVRVASQKIRKYTHPGIANHY